MISASTFGQHSVVVSLSVVIPAVDGHSALIRRSVLSAADSNVDAEVLLVQFADPQPFPDGVSPAGARVRILRAPHSVGLAAAINLGVAEAFGDVVGILSPGSFYEPGALEIVEARFRADPGLDVLHGSCHHQSVDGSRRWTEEGRPWNVKEALISSTATPPRSATFVRRRRLADLPCRFDHTWDLDLYIRLAETQGKVLLEPTALATQLEPLKGEVRESRFGDELLAMADWATRPGSPFRPYRRGALAAAHSRAMTETALSLAGSARHGLAASRAQPWRSLRFVRQGRVALRRPRNRFLAQSALEANLRAAPKFLLLATLILAAREYKRSDIVKRAAQ